MIRLAADHPAFACHRQDRAPIIVALPIGVGDVVAVAAPPWLTCINTRRDGDALRRRHHQTIRAAKRAVKKPGIIGDVVHRGENTGVNAVHLHQIAQPGKAVVVFRCGKRQHAVALVKAVRLWTFRHDQTLLGGVDLRRTPKDPGVQDDSRAFLQAKGRKPLRRRHRPMPAVMMCGWADFCKPVWLSPCDFAAQSHVKPSKTDGGYNAVSD